MSDLKSITKANRRKSCTCELTLTVSPEAVAYLKQLAVNGLFGDSPEEAARVLLSERLRDLASEGWVE